MFDLVTVGELLVDLISDDADEGLAGADRFQAHVGGAPTNTAITASLLGGAVATVGCLGRCGLGDKVIAGLEEWGIDTFVQRIDQPTTVAVVSRSTETPEFVIIRGADRMLAPFSVPPGRWMHTSMFALSRDPQRGSIIQAIRAFGGVVSLDANYAGAVWGDLPPEPVLEQVGPHIDVVKASTDDCRRLFGPGSKEDYVRRLAELGFGAVLLTHGAKDVTFVADGVTEETPVPARDVVDVTGAGDALVAGVIMARLDGMDWREAVSVGIEVAGRSVEVVGHVPGPIDRESLYATLVA